MGLSKLMTRDTRILLTCQREETCLGLDYGRQFNDTDPTRLCYVARWRVYSRLHNQCFGTQISKVRIKFAGAISWIERCTRCASSHGEASHSHLWAIRQHEHDPVMTAQAHGMERLHYITSVLM